MGDENKNQFTEEVIQGLFQTDTQPVDTVSVYEMRMLTDEPVEIRELKKDDIKKELNELYKLDANQKVWEIRIFSELGEVKWFRTSLDPDEALKYREQINDQNLKPDQYWDVEQYLDIDTKQSVSKNLDGTVTVYATGGGSYTLPEMNNYNDLKIKIRNYLDYGQDGSLYVKDWRIVGFVEVEENDTGNGGN